MPPSPTGLGGKFRRILLVVTPVVLACAAYGFVQLGPFLAKEDPLDKADAIFVLAGTHMTRPLEGADLLIAGYAPRIVISREPQEQAFEVIARKGLVFETDAERARDVFVTLGVPREAILVPDRIHMSTAAEAITLRELAARYAWRRIIVVTSKYHLRRAAFAFRRELRGTGVEVLMRGSRYDGAEPDRWWRRRFDIREIIPEVPKLIAYLLGLGA